MSVVVFISQSMFYSFKEIGKHSLQTYLVHLNYENSFHMHFKNFNLTALQQLCNRQQIVKIDCCCL